MITRISYEIAITNHTGEELTCKESHLDDGVWSRDGNFMPPDKIPSGETVHFGSESHGLMGGTEGHFLYMSSVGNCRVHWRNPYADKNSTSVECSHGIQEEKSDIPHAQNATLTVVFHVAS